MPFWKKSPPKLLDQPRAHHYTFAHLAVRAVALDDPLRFFALVASEDRRKVVEWLWDLVCKNTEGAEKPDFGADDIALTTCRVADLPTMVFAMPEPRAVTEAHFVAIVLTGDGGEGGNGTARYFTLECGDTLEGGARTVLCEWTQEAHANFGDGPPAELAPFLAAVEAKLRG